MGGKDPSVAPLATLEAYHPEASSWSLVGRLSKPRTAPGVTTMESGRALVVGGYDQTARGAASFLAEALVYGDDAPLAAIAPLATGRFGHSTTRLADGRVLACGGWGASGALSSCEVTVP